MPQFKPVYQTQPTPPIEQMVVTLSRNDIQEILTAYTPTNGADPSAIRLRQSSMNLGDTNE